MDIKTDRGTYLPSPVINPNSLGPAGWWFIDGLSGVKITRLTDELDGAGFGTTYSIWPTANRDNTRLYLLNSATNTYYTAEFDPSSGTRIGHLRAVPSLPARLFSNYESFLWSGSDPDKGFLFVDARLMSYQPSTQTYQVVKDLTSQLGTDYYFLQQHKSADDKRFAASGPLGFVVYDVERDRVLLDVRTTDMNGIALDRSGRWLLYVPEDDNTEYIYNVETGTREQITSHSTSGLPDFTIGHCDVGSDFVAGDNEWEGGISARRLSEPHVTTLPFAYAPYWISYHLCMTADDQNWALISSYGALPVSADSNKFKDECFLVGVQGDAVGKIKRLFHHRAVANDPLFAKRYWQISKANMSRDGRFVFFTSNMGGGPNHLYSADLGATTTTPEPPPLPTPPPTPTPTPTPDPAPTPPIDLIPVVALASPANGATLSGRTTVTATVTNAIEVYLIIDDLVRGMLTGTPYSIELDTTKLSEGEHSLFVRAWNAAGRSGDSARVNITVRNTVVEPPPPPPADPPPVEPPPVPIPPTPTPKPCSISVFPPVLNIPRNGSGVIAVSLNDLTGPTEVRVTGFDGQVGVTPLVWNAGPTSTVKQFQVKVKNKRHSKVITFSSSCGSAKATVNVV